MANAVRLLLILLLLPATVAAASKPAVLFDQAHGQLFRVEASGPLQLSGLAEIFGAAGFTIATTSERLTGERLAKADVLVISGPFKPLDDAEVAQVLEFLEKGGGLAIMLHIAPPLRSLLHRLEVDFANGTLRQPGQGIRTDPLNFRIRDLAEHPLTSGLDGFWVYGAWALRGTADQVKVIGRTSPQAWIDLDRDGRFSSRDAAQAFGVLAVGSRGHGRYVVFGDDALFQNRFLDRDNRQLAANLAAWLMPGFRP